MYGNWLGNPTGKILTKWGVHKKYPDDGVHPTCAGYAMMKSIIIRSIHTALDNKNKN